MHSQFDEIHAHALETERPGLPSRNIVLLGFSKLLERTSYYGVRSIITLYLIRGAIGMGDNEAVSLYGTYAASIGFFGVLGSLIGDFWSGNRNAIIAGGILQAIGAFCLAFIPTITGVYLGLGAVAFGAGLFSFNLNASYAKEYLRKPLLLDSSMTTLYLLAELGGLLGALLIARTAEVKGYYLAFLIAGGITALATAIAFFFRRNTIGELQKEKQKVNNTWVFILLAIFSGILLFLGNRITSSDIFNAQQQVTNNSIFSSGWAFFYGLSALLSFVLGLVAAISWLYYRIASIYKLGLGFLFGMVGMVFLLFLPTTPSNVFVGMLMSSSAFLTLAQVFIVPITLSIIAKHSNPKYLATIFSIASLIPSLVLLGWDASITAIAPILPSSFLTATVLMGLGALLVGGCVLMVRRSSGVGRRMNSS